jgi:hypothetical protein
MGAREKKERIRGHKKRHAHKTVTAENNNVFLRADAALNLHNQPP